ncbi:hypothetical protein LC087_17550 [Bacillus carboniphilus]|uniref:Uncharacterized protein n=1 Tax=Bacillus carboniphilus TaxID=86663 RepID=A0ABY9JVF2_9BACI|nr:hypothetical protein [Bacillus carboniphilus]WLR42478.1 hypothetical protein LC087_17550 [Bacillus carboniphilus]
MATTVHQIKWNLPALVLPTTTTPANLQVVANVDAVDLVENYSARFVLSDPTTPENFVIMFNVDENPRRLEFNSAGVAVLPDVFLNETVAGTFRIEIPFSGFITYQLFEQETKTVVAERIVLIEGIKTPE